MKKADIRGIGDKKFQLGIGHFEDSRNKIFDSISHTHISASLDNISRRQPERVESLTHVQDIG